MKVLFKKYLFLAILLYAGNSFAQDVVLVNGDATKVVIKDKNITTINSKVPNYMNGFQAGPNDGFTKVPPRLGTQAVAINDVSTVRNMTKVGSKKPNYKKVSFEEEKFDISTDGQKFLNTIANTIKSGEVKSILLKTNYLSENKADISLMRRRLNATKRYLEEKGVQSNLILTSMVAKDSKTSDISILMKK